MPSRQTMTEAERRIVASWAADCAERVLHVFEAEAPDVAVPREAIAAAREHEPQARKALQQLPPLGEDSAGPLGSGLLASGVLGTTIRTIQAEIGGAVEADN